jgi:signal transduction histidine kinase
MTSSIQEAAPATDLSRFNAAEWLEEHAAGDILMTPDGWMTAANRPARRIFRLPPAQEVRGLNFRRFCRQPARFADTIQAIRTAGFVGSWDADLVAMDGRIVHAVVNLVGEFEAGFLTAVRVQLFDIADWRRSQERTLFGQRIEAIGRLAGGVAHDFNNLLMVITGHAECLSAAFEADSPMTRSVSAIQASAARAATLTEKLLSFGRRQVLQPRVVDPRNMVRTLEQGLRRAAGALTPIMVEADRVWPVRIDEARTQGALSAIASHALETMDGGTLTFQLANADIGPEWSPTRAFVKPGRFVRIDIVCTGMTLDADTHVRMFEPFFSETGVVRDGMGLAAAFGTVKQGGGYMWIEADRPGSTTFTVLLPAVVAEDDVDAGDCEAAAPATVIVVDPDDGVRRMIVKILATQRYVVLGAATPEEALRLGERGGIDVLLVDAVPDVAWTELADAMRRDSPALRLIGLAGAPDADDRACEGAAVVLQKPFTAAELLDHVRSVLDA